MGKYYTVYDERTEEIIAFGNASQCTAILGLKNTRQFHAFVSKTRSGLRKNYKVVIEDDGEESDSE
ncbi:hypothetical protein [uncultured Clostridium sp.]|uniref:hypothetical protein n=1 Tax=uncultured Clostridium sp. TaxID=59620 RepID=UPI0025E1F76C|nr:hypothetical protein [uncultured Clostridium sp.]